LLKNDLFIIIFKLYENRELRRIFGLKRDEMGGSWRNLHNEEVHNLYSSDIHVIGVISSGRIRWTGHVSTYGGEEACI
jgi:hypothetical protein